jgi:hypothetical protein
VTHRQAGRGAALAAALLLAVPGSAVAEVSAPTTSPSGVAAGVAAQAPGPDPPGAGFVSTLPFAVPTTARPDGASDEPAGSGSRGLFIPLATGLLLLVAALHLRWFTERATELSESPDLPREPLPPGSPEIVVGGRSASHGR